MTIKNDELAIYSEDFNKLGASMLEEVTDRSKLKVSNNTSTTNDLLEITKGFLRLLTPSDDIDDSTTPSENSETALNESDETIASMINSTGNEQSNQDISNIDIPKANSEDTSECDSSQKHTDYNSINEVASASFEKLEGRLSFDTFPSYRYLKEPNIKYMRMMRRVMHKKFVDYSNFIDFFNSYVFNHMTDVRTFLFFHLIYTIEHPDLYVYYLDGDYFSDDPLTGGLWNQIKYIGRTIYNL